MTTNPKPANRILVIGRVTSDFLRPRSDRLYTPCCCCCCCLFTLGGLAGMVVGAATDIPEVLSLGDARRREYSSGVKIFWSLFVLLTAVTASGFLMRNMHVLLGWGLALFPVIQIAIAGALTLFLPDYSPDVRPLVRRRYLRILWGALAGYIFGAIVLFMILSARR